MKLHELLNKYDFTKLILKGFSFSFLINIFNLLIAFITQLILARLLGVQSFGYYSFVITVLAFLILPSKLGLDIVTTRFISAYRAVNDKGKELGLLKRSNLIVLMFSLLITGIAILITFGTPGLKTELKVTFLIGFLCLPLMSLTVLRQNALQAYKLVVHAQLPEKVLRPLLFILFIILISSISTLELNAPLVITFYLFATILSFSIGTYFLRKKIFSNLKNIKPIYETKNWIFTSIPLMFVSGMYLLLGQLDVLMLGVMTSTDYSGIYTVALKIASFVSFGLTAVNIITAPLISEAFVQKKIIKLQNICSLSAVLGTSFALLGVFIILIFNEFILDLFGEEFTSAKIALLILGFSNLVNAIAGQTGTVMNMTGQQRSLSIVLFITVMLNFLMNLTLIPIFGIEGAAVATLLSTCVWNFLMIFLVLKTHGINPSLFGLLSVLKGRASK